MDPDIFDDLKNPPPIGEPEFWHDGNGRRIAWNAYGDPSGRPVFYYHGWPSSRLQARAAHHLAEARGIRLIALDRPGMGRSSPVPGRKLEDWAELVKGFADAHGIGRFGQLGVSGGGPYVLPCAALLPDRVAGSAVLCGAVPLAAENDRSGLHPLYRLMIALRRLPPSWFTPGFKLGGRMARGDLKRPPLSWLIASLPEQDRDVLLQHPDVVPVFVASFEEGVRQGGPGVLADAEVYFRRWELDLSAISSEIRYWHGGLDRNIPAALVRRLVARIPSATLEEAPYLGHFSLALLRAREAMDHLAACR